MAGNMHVRRELYKFAFYKFVFVSVLLLFFVLVCRFCISRILSLFDQQIKTWSKEREKKQLAINSRNGLYGCQLLLHVCTSMCQYVTVNELFVSNSLCSWRSLGLMSHLGMKN